VNKEGWPEFPLWWLEETRRNMDSLKEITSHLHEKTETYKNHASGVRGEINEVERQIVEHITVLRQQVGVLTDVVQSSLQIIAEEHWQRTHKVERLFAWIRNVAKKVETKLSENVFYRILAIVSTLATLWLLVSLGKVLFHFIRGGGR
jgi:hypothetical protein